MSNACDERAADRIAGTRAKGGHDLIPDEFSAAMAPVLREFQGSDALRGAKKMGLAN